MTKYKNGDIIVSQNKNKEVEMGKSVYSLVLNDDIVEYVDRLAYDKNTNRSNMINQILAEYFSLVTPEQQTREVFDRIEQILNGRGTLRLMMSPSDTMMSLRSALMYKYNPTVKYSVELYRNEYPVIGELRVSMRTQNNTLILYMMQFFKLWMQTESRYIGATEYSIEGGKLCRKIKLRINNNSSSARLNSSTLGELIAEYIGAFDKAMKIYFSHIEDPTLASHEISRVFEDYLKRSPEII